MQNRFLFVLLGLLLSGSAWAQGPRKPPPRKLRPAAVVEAVQTDPEPYAFSPHDSLLLAAATNDVPLARRLLARGAEVNRPYSDTLNPYLHRQEMPAHKLTLPDWTQASEGETALHLAVTRGHLALTDLLLRHGANPAQPDAAGRSALCRAVDFVPNQVALVERLLATGVPPDSCRCPEPLLLHLLGYNGRMRQAYAWAQREGRPETAAARQRRRYRMGARRRPQAPLHPLRSDSLNLYLARVLLAAGAQPTPEALFAAIGTGDAVLARYLLTHGVPVGSRTAAGATALHQATEQAAAGLVQLLLTQGADPNVVDGEGRTPLSIAAVFASPQLLEVLLAAGAAPGGGCPPGRADCRDDQLTTPLHEAVSAGRPAAVRRLLAAGAPTTTCNRELQTPLQVAVATYPPYLSAMMVGWQPENAEPARQPAPTLADTQEVLRLLLAAGASPNVTTPYGDAPLRDAVSYDDTLRAGLLLRAGADPQHLNRVGYPAWERVSSEEMLGLMQRAGGRFGAASGSILLNLMLGNKALPLAVTRAVLAEGGDLCETSSDGDTPLHLLAANPEADLLTAALLLAHGAGREEWNRRGQTPLDLAIEARRPALVQLLLDAGAQATPDALLNAALGGSEALVALLLAHGAPANYPYPGCHCAPLLEAVACPSAGAGLVARLLAAGADAAVTDSLGNSPLHQLARWHRAAVDQPATLSAADWDNPAPPLAPELRRQTTAWADARLRAIAPLLLRAGTPGATRNRAGETAADLLRATDTPGSRQLRAGLEQAEKQSAAGGK